MHLKVWHEFRRCCRCAILACSLEGSWRWLGFPAFIYRRVQASCRVRRHSHLQCNMWRQASQDAHPYHENKSVLAQKKKRQCEKNGDRGKHHYSPRRSDDAERQCDIDLWLQSFARPRAQFLTYCACSDISDAPSSRPARQRSTRPKPLTAPCRHSQLRAPLVLVIFRFLSP